MKFALISADGSHRVKFRMNGETSDCTSFMNWIDVWGGMHFSFSKLREEDSSYLKQFDVVMMSGHPSYIQDIIKIAGMLKDSQAISMFYPEGSWQLYDNSIRGFHMEYYDAWRACDVLSIAEEDKRGYYESFVGKETVVRFIHVPMSPEMEMGNFFVSRTHKSMRVMVYGDNNPNHPLVAIAAASRVVGDVTTVEFGGCENQVSQLFPSLRMLKAPKMAQNPFLRNLGRTIVHFYPTEWIGTNRQVVSCAAVGTPCVGSYLSHTQQRLFPNLSAAPHDVDEMVSKAKFVMESDVRYDFIARRAFKEAVDFYGLEPTKKRFLNAVEDAVKIKNKSRVPV